MTAKRMKLVLVTGLSGAGKGVALKTLEDCGFEAIDNIPLAFLPSVVSSAGRARHLAVGSDVRSRDFSLKRFMEAIVPLKMQQIADVVGVHVTTVSRAVDDKYVQTPRGIFPLKRFFGGGTTTAGGEEVAWDIIRIKLKEIIAAEDKNHPLSDDDLVKELAKHGYDLARRTITKYRKALKIPSSRQRRAY